MLLLVDILRAYLLFPTNKTNNSRAFVTYGDNEDINLLVKYNLKYELISLCYHIPVIYNQNFKVLKSINENFDANSAIPYDLKKHQNSPIIRLNMIIFSYLPYLG